MIGLVTGLKGFPHMTNVAVDGTAVKIVFANRNRKAVGFQNQGGATVFLGPTSAVTTSGATAGYALFAGTTASDTATDQEWWAITAGSTVPVNIIEVI